MSSGDSGPLNKDDTPIEYGDAPPGAVQFLSPSSSLRLSQSLKMLLNALSQYQNNGASPEQGAFWFGIGQRLELNRRSGFQPRIETIAAGSRSYARPEAVFFVSWSVKIELK